MRFLLPVFAVILWATACLADEVPDAPAGHLRIGTWNIANFHAMEGKTPEGRESFATSRETANYQWLASTAADIGFDLVALQEIHSPEAVRRVFPEADYAVCFEAGRKAADQLIPIEKRDAIYTAVAIRKSKFSDVSCFEFGGLSIDHTEAGVTRKVRGGTGAVVTIGGKNLTLLSIHLKSSCSKQKIDPPATDHCETLGNQLPLLNDWIDAEFAKSANVIIAGDFNRVMEFDGDQFWPRFDDGNPAALNLFRIPFGNDSDASNICVDRPLQIDHIVFPKEVFDGAGEVLDYESGTFRKLPIPGATKKEREKLSDHCPEWGDFKVND